MNLQGANTKRNATIRPAIEASATMNIDQTNKILRQTHSIFKQAFLIQIILEEIFEHLSYCKYYIIFTKKVFLRLILGFIIISGYRENETRSQTNCQTPDSVSFFCVQTKKFFW